MLAYGPMKTEHSPDYKHLDKNSVLNFIIIPLSSPETFSKFWGNMFSCLKVCNDLFLPKQTNKTFYPVMYDSSACEAVYADCLKCPKAVDNLILYASHSRGFHFIMPKCDNNIIMFLLKGEALVNSEEYAGGDVACR